MVVSYGKELVRDGLKQMQRKHVGWDLGILQKVESIVVPKHMIVKHSLCTAYAHSRSYFHQI